MADGAEDSGRVGEEVEEAAREVRSGLAGLGRGGEGEAPARGVELLGRVGLVGYGIVHLLVGVIAVQVALGSRGGQADQQGALATIAAEPLGLVLIGVIVVGLVAFGIWHGLAALTGFRWTSGWDRTQKRIGSGARALAVFGVAALGVRLLVTGSSGSSTGGSRQATADLLTLPAGRALVGLVALVVAIAAVATCWTGVRRDFLEELDRSRLPAWLRTPFVWVGVAGHALRAVAFGVMAVLFATAASTADPSRAGGIDAALKTLAEQPFGPFLLFVVAVGFVAFGLYLFGEARARRI
ncbi:DUF1206 domain-containing protein [Actinomycetospora sp. TBRC 11914]|uniref:DUF1206 domain-containing protein n=1 Tax=Actinomycetospora sp. TBRC 11914 TaxID=2729387 RepID=UPI00145F8A93|nr:DUF1206 domain-containing protein [Actinomycetospora sp. TBRC 11914]NMO93502.1 DUF1206 domain-containing protein [Actinomycetospora sp. TBRC 11914]